MSVEQVARSDGTKVWRVRWRDEHGRNRSKTLGRKRDAEAFDAEIRRMRPLGELGLMDAGRETLAEFGRSGSLLTPFRTSSPRACGRTNRCGTVTSCRTSAASSCASCVRPCSTGTSHSSSATGCRLRA
jgi:hypothetical protein